MSDIANKYDINRRKPSCRAQSENYAAIAIFRTCNMKIPLFYHVSFVIKEIKYIRTTRLNKKAALLKGKLSY